MSDVQATTCQWWTVEHEKICGATPAPHKVKIQSGFSRSSVLVNLCDQHKAAADRLAMQARVTHKQQKAN